MAQVVAFMLSPVGSAGLAVQLVTVPVTVGELVVIVSVCP